MTEDEKIIEHIEIEQEVHDEKIKKKKNKKQEAADTEKYIRLLAEFDNFKKRTMREKAVMRDDGVQAAVLKFLPVIDNFERAMAAYSGDENVQKGFDMILRQMKDALAGLGVAEIAAVGEVFDPNRHEAVMMVESSEYESGVVAEELMKGYLYRDKVVRFSMVKVVG